MKTGYFRISTDIPDCYYVEVETEETFHVEESMREELVQKLSVFVAESLLSDSEGKFVVDFQEFRLVRPDMMVTTIGMIVGIGHTRIEDVDVGEFLHEDYVDESDVVSLNILSGDKVFRRNQVLWERIR